MELELEMGPGCSDLHQARCKVPLGAFLTTWRSAQRLCRGVGKGLSTEGPPRLPASATSEGARGGAS